MIIKPQYYKLDMLPDCPKIMVYSINEEEQFIIAGVSGYGRITLWEGDEVEDHIYDSELKLKERLIEQILKVD